MTERPVLFYVFARRHPPRESYLAAQEAEARPYAHFHLDGFIIERPALPDFMESWKRTDVTVSPEIFDTYWSDITLPDEMLQDLPDFIWLSGHLMVSARAREVLDRHAVGCITWIPKHVAGERSGQPAPGGHQLLFPRFHFRYPDSGKPLKPEMDFHPLTNGDLILQIQKERRVADYLSEIPLWQMFPARSAPAFSPELYRHLKEQDLTGLIEKGSERWIEWNDDETIGHVFERRRKWLLG